MTQEPEAEDVDLSLQALAGLAGTEDEIRSLLQARSDLEKQLMIDPGEKALAAAEDGAAGFGNVTGVAIAEKEVGDVPTGELSVEVFVKEKLSDEEVASEEMVPAAIGGIRTDVQVTGELYANGPGFRRRHRELTPELKRELPRQLEGSSQDRRRGRD